MNVLLVGFGPVLRRFCSNWSVMEIHRNKFAVIAMDKNVCCDICHWHFVTFVVVTFVVDTYKICRW